MDEIITRLLNYAFDHGIEYILTTDLSPITPSATDGHNIVINLNWHVKNQLPFHISHEVGHVLNGDDECPLSYFTLNSDTIEAAASKKGIELLIPLYFDRVGLEDVNPYLFMNQLGIPDYLEPTVLHTFSKEMADRL